MQLFTAYTFPFRIKHTRLSKNNEFLFVLITNDKDSSEVHFVNFEKQITLKLYSSSILYDAICEVGDSYIIIVNHKSGIIYSIPFQKFLGERFYEQSR